MLDILFIYLFILVSEITVMSKFIFDALSKYSRSQKVLIREHALM